MISRAPFLYQASSVSAWRKRRLQWLCKRCVDLRRGFTRLHQRSGFQAGPGPSRQYAVGLGLLAGTVLLLAVFLQQDFSTVLASARSIGWGLVPLVLAHLLPMALDGLAWRIIVPPAHRPQKADAIYFRWIGEAVSGFLPGAYLGGEVVRIRLAAFRGCPEAVAIVIAMVDLLLGAFVQVALLAAGLLAVILANGLGMLWVSGLLLTSCMIIAIVLCKGLRDRHVLVAMQPLRRLGVCLHTRGYRAGARKVRSSTRALRQFSADGSLLGWSAAIRIGSWIFAVAELCLGLALLGQPVSLANAFLLELLTQTARTAAFFIPAGLGVQEAVLLLVSAGLGISPENALALSMLKRCRELLLGLPALLAWQADECRRWWRLQARVS